jgi:hypothetical protein
VDEIGRQVLAFVIEIRLQSDSHQYTFTMTFDSEEAVSAYQAHPGHHAAVERWGKVGDKVTMVTSWQ